MALSSNNNYDTRLSHHATLTLNLTLGDVLKIIVALNFAVFPRTYRVIWDLFRVE